MRKVRKKLFSFFKYPCFQAFKKQPLWAIEQKPFMRLSVWVSLLPVSFSLHTKRDQHVIEFCKQHLVFPKQLGTGACLHGCGGGNPLSRGRKIARVHIQSHNLGMPGWSFSSLSGFGILLSQKCDDRSLSETMPISLHDEGEVELRGAETPETDHFSNGRSTHRAWNHHCSWT